MADFTLDTSGVVPFEGGTLGVISWEGVGQVGGAFTQGYIEALLSSSQDQIWESAAFGADEPEVDASWGFSDLAPEALARIIADCAKHQNGPRPWMNTAVAGAAWLADRRNGYWVGEAGPLETPYLGDDGRVYLREGA